MEQVIIFMLVLVPMLFSTCPAKDLLPSRHHR